MKTMATIWLDGCSGCHMSFLDMDERLLELASQVKLVYSPLVDRKDFPEMVDIAVVEGAVSSEDDLAKIQKVRAHCATLIALGDCSVNSNVPAMRNGPGVQAVCERGYADSTPLRVVPKLLRRVSAVHEVVKVDVFVPGCPPAADTIYYVLSELLAGRTPDVNSKTRFGA